jgi:hypothetical protein
VPLAADPNRATRTIIRRTILGLDTSSANAAAAFPPVRAVVTEFATGFTIRCS